MSPENTEKIRVLEQQELAFWRGTVSKRPAGRTRDGSSEETASWTMEAQRLCDRERIHHERCQNGGRLHGWSGWISFVVKGHTRIFQAMFEWKRLADRKEFGTVSLKVLSWNVAGLSADSTDIFLSQISMLTDWDVLLLQECFRKLDGVNVGAHELLTPCELLGDCDAQQSSCIRDGADKQKLLVERAGGLQSSWRDR